MNIRISSRAFSNGFDIITPVETFSAKRSPFGEMLISNASGTQIARLGPESFFSNAYNIIISGGGFYQFRRDKDARRTWACKGEGRLLHISEHRRRRFEITEASQRVAECSKGRFGNDYAIVVNDSEMKLVICIVLALSVSEHQSSDIPG